MGFYITQILNELKRTNTDGSQEDLDVTDEVNDDDNGSEYDLDTNDEEDEPEEPTEDNTDTTEEDPVDDDNDEEYNLDTTEDATDDLDMTDDNAPEDNTTEPGDTTDDVNDEPADYSLDSNDDPGSDDSSDMGDGLGGTDPEAVDPDAKIKEIEKNMNTLTPEQEKLQNNNLKKQYLELYNNCQDLVTRLNDIAKNSDNEEEITCAINSIQDLKKLIFDYLVNVYDTKTFTQNSIIYTEYLVTLSSVNKLIKELNVKK